MGVAAGASLVAYEMYNVHVRPEKSCWRNHNYARCTVPVYLVADLLPCIISGISRNYSKQGRKADYKTVLTRTSLFIISMVGNLFVYHSHNTS